jgi:hypothetical protein
MSLCRIGPLAGLSAAGLNALLGFDLQLAI